MKVSMRKDINIFNMIELFSLNSAEKIKLAKSLIEDVVLSDYDTNRGEALNKIIKALKAF